MNAQEQLIALASNDTQVAVAKLTIKMAQESRLPEGETPEDYANGVAQKALNLIESNKANFGWACAYALGHK